MHNSSKDRTGQGYRPWKSWRATGEPQPQHFQEGHLQFPSTFSAAQDRSGAARPVHMEDEGAVETRRVLGGRSAPQNTTLSSVVFQKDQIVGLHVVH